MANETYADGKRDLLTWQKRPTHKQKRPTCFAKETYAYAKRDLHVWQKRPNTFIYA